MLKLELLNDPLILDETNYESSFLKNNLHDAITASGMMTTTGVHQKAQLEALYQQLTELFSTKLKRHMNDLGDENSDPASNPLFWVSKWVDYSDKYGFGYQLCDEGMGVMFNDTTKLIMLANGM